MQENWNPWILDWNSKPQKFFKKNPEMEKSKKIDPNHKSSLKKIENEFLG